MTLAFSLPCFTDKIHSALRSCSFPSSLESSSFEQFLTYFLPSSLSPSHLFRLGSLSLPFLPPSYKTHSYSYATHPHDTELHPGEALQGILVIGAFLVQSLNISILGICRWLESRGKMAYLFKRHFCVALY